MTQGSSANKKSIGGWPRSQILAATVMVVAVLGAIVAFAYWRVCEEQVTTAGQVVEVCRRIQVTDPPVVAAAAIVAVALGAFFTEVGAFGFSLKREVAKAQEAASNSLAAAESAQEAARHAEGAERSATRAEQLAAKLNEPRQEFPLESTETMKELETLAAEYNTLRRTLPPGSERTDRMTDIIARMIAIGQATELGENDISRLLSAPDRGIRLASYALLYARPMPKLTLRLTQAAVEEDKPFGQYWALRALRRQIAMDRDSLDLNSRRRLQELQSQLGSGTDRGYELREILRMTPPR